MRTLDSWVLPGGRVLACWCAHCSRCHLRGRASRKERELVVVAHFLGWNGSYRVRIVGDAPPEIALDAKRTRPRGPGVVLLCQTAPEMWKEFLTVFSAVVLGGGGLGYWFRDRWTHSLSRELEEFKASLAADLLEKQVKFGSLHREQMRVLIPLYKILSDVNAACQRYVGARLLLRDGVVSEDHVTKAWSRGKTALEGLEKFRRENEVILGPALVGQLCTLSGKYWDVLSGEAFGDALKDAVQEVDGEIAPLLGDIQEAIQHMLGVS